MKITMGQLPGGLAQLLGGGDDDDPNVNDPRVKASLEEAARENRGVYSPEMVARQTLNAFAEYSKPHDFKVGDLVQLRSWAPHKFPTADRPGVVIEVLAEPVTDPSAADGPDFRKKLDIVVGSIRAGHFMSYHYDRRDLEPYTGPVEPA